VLLCVWLWLTAPNHDATIWGRYGIKWFIATLAGNVFIILCTIALVRVSRQSPTTKSKNAGGLSRAKCLLFTILLLLMVTVILEIGLRIAGLPPGERPFRPLAGTTQAYHCFLQNVDRVRQGDRLVRSYRGRVHALEKTTAVRIVCLGGSTTWGHGVGAEGTWPAILEKNLRSRGYDAEVINAGVPWYTTAHSLINYTLQIRRLEPDVVIILHGINDLARSFPPANELPFEPDYGSYQGPMHNVLSGYQAHLACFDPEDWHPWKLMTSSALYRLLFDRPTPPSEMPPVDVGLERFPSLASFRENLAYLTKLCLGDGRHVVLCTQAYLHGSPAIEKLAKPDETMRAQFFLTRQGQPISNRSLARAMARVQAHTFEIAQRMGVPVADACRAIGGDNTYFIDDVHLNAEGNAIVARTVAETLEPILARLADVDRLAARAAAAGEDLVRKE
jgi:lysophospholipase L1-like esterase